MSGISEGDVITTRVVELCGHQLVVSVLGHKFAQSGMASAFLLLSVHIYLPLLQMLNFAIALKVFWLSAAKAVSFQALQPYKVVFIFHF